MTKDEALKLALEALESASNAIESWGSYASEYFQDKHDLQVDINNTQKAITSIKEALALQEYDYKDLYEKEKRKSAMWLAKYEEVAGPAPKAIPMTEPEQDGKCKHCTDGCHACDARKLPEQEPVAWLHRFIEGGISIGLKPADLERHPERWEPLYTTPPQQELVCVCGAVWEGQELIYTTPQRTWVGLTDDEVGNLSDFAYANDEEFVRNVEKHLKEKNSG